MNIWKKIRQWFGKKEATTQIAYQTVLKDLQEVLSPSPAKEVACDVKVGTLKKAIYYYFPPFTWERIGLLLYKEFMHYGKPFGKIEETDCILSELVQKIDEALQLLYRKGLPREILKK